MIRSFIDYLPSGREFTDYRSTISMTKTEPPPGWTWSNAHRVADYNGRAPTPPPEEDTWKLYRMIWLDQFDLEISLEPEKGYRVWRWLGELTNQPSGHTARSGEQRRVRWQERRPWKSPLPKTPGFWPADE